MYAVINAAYLVIPCSCFVVVYTRAVYDYCSFWPLECHPLFAFIAGCHLHAQHSADQCQCAGTGTTGAGPPSAAAPGHDRLPGTCWARSELLISPHIAN